MSINWFEWGGVRSDTHELLIAEKNIYNAPQRDVELVHVPGRNGDVLIDKGGWNNVDVSYTVQFVGLPEKAPTLRQWLQATGYHVLRDSYQPGYFRHGVFTSQMNPEEIARKVGRLQLIFSCKPFLYRDDGDTMVYLFISGSTIANPEAYESLPEIQIVGTGNVELFIGNRQFAIQGVDEYIVLDSEMMCAYKDDTLCNNKIQFTQFPTLRPGYNVIQWSGDVAEICITPRWRTL